MKKSDGFTLDPVKRDKIMKELHKKYLEKIGMSEEEYMIFCKPQLEKVSEFQQLAKIYSEKKSQLKDYLLEHTVRTEYSSGGECLHRGFYCPSPIFDITAGNISRGRLCREANPKAQHKHLFDAEGRQVGCVKLLPEAFPEYCEYILWDGRESLGISFSGDLLEKISRCKYDESGRIASYEHALLYLSGSTELGTEIYSYTDAQLIVERTRILDVYSPPTMTVDKYTFSVEDGLLKSYTVEIHSTQDISHLPVEERTYTIRKKRKI